MNKIPVFILLLLSFLACNRQDSLLKDALQQSGENRGQWEKVLNHYSVRQEDSLKYKAAVFLIGNMPGHYWYEGEKLDAYQILVDSIYRDWRLDQRRMLKAFPLNLQEIGDRLEKKQDLLDLDADFLIHHINHCFRIREKMPWLRELSFADFCEYILPYRIGYEKPARWTPEEEQAAEDVLRTVAFYDDVKYDPLRVKDIYSPIGHYVFLGNVKMEFDGQLLEIKPNECNNASMSEFYDHFIHHIPAAIDFTPAFPHRNDRHTWTSVISPRSPGQLYTRYENEKVGKIYRKTFSRQRVPVPDGKEFIPPFFRNPFNKDVTALYSSVAGVTVKPSEKVRQRYIYLCVFNDLQWTPVAFSEMMRGKADFEDLGCGVAYLPVVYEGEEQVPVAAPFILRQGGAIEWLSPDTTVGRELSLKRKYPTRFTFQRSFRALSGARIEVDMDSSFRHPLVVARLGETEQMRRISIDIQTDTAYRYWRLIFADRGGNLAELTFYDRMGMQVRVERVLTAGIGFGNAPVIFDQNALTFTPVISWVGWDFGKPVRLQTIHCLPRNDDNGISPGDSYELFYQGSQGWISLGEREATSDSLVYTRVPQNALLLLKNYTKGREERIFTCNEKGEVRFW